MTSAVGERGQVQLELCRDDSRRRLEQIGDEAAESWHNVFAVKMVFAGQHHALVVGAVYQHLFAHRINDPHQVDTSIKVLVDLERNLTEFVVRRNDFDGQIGHDLANSVWLDVIMVAPVPLLFRRYSPIANLQSSTDQTASRRLLEKAFAGLTTII